MLPGRFDQGAVDVGEQGPFFGGEHGHGAQGVRGFDGVDEQIDKGLLKLIAVGQRGGQPTRFA